ncbi:unnamed protein product, partial [Brenthis ino]
MAAVAGLYGLGDEQRGRHRRGQAAAAERSESRDDNTEASEVVREINEWAAEAKQSHENAEQQWYKLKTKVHKINANILKPDKWVAKEPWMTEKIYQLMEKRRLHKNDDKLYKTIDREIRREVRYARNSWYRKKCDHLEVLHNKHDAFNLHKESRAMVLQTNAKMEPL